MTSPNEITPAAMTAASLYERLKVLRQAIDDLSRAASFDDICRRTVELGRSLLGFDRLALFFLTDEPGVVVGTYGTDTQGQLRDERQFRIPYDDSQIIELLRKHDRRLVVRKNHQLVDGSGIPVGMGWHITALLWNGDEGIGWIVVDNLLLQRPLTEDDQEIISLYATTIGHLAHIKRAEEALRYREEIARAFQDRLKILHDVTTELAKTETFDALCEQAVLLGKHRLGFDRLGLWFIDDRDPAFLIGTFGINENGEIRDERHERVANNFDAEMVELVTNNVLVSARNDVPLYNQRHDIVGYGGNAAAQVRDGLRLMGWLSTDNFFRQQPFTDYELELLALYASSIGHLASRQKAIEMQIEERRLLRTILDAVPDEIFVRDRDGRYLLLNRQAWAIMPGVNSDQEVVGKTVFDVMPPDLAHRYHNDDQIVLSLGTSLLNIEEPGRTTSGATRSLLTTKVPLTDQQGEIMGLLGVARDITELKAAQQQALDAAVYQTRVRLLYEVINNISHDFKSPLSIIHTSLYLMQRKPEVDHSARLQLIKTQADLLERYIQQLLIISRLETTGVETWQPLNLNDLPVILSVAFDPQAQARGITLTWQLHDAPLTILGSAHQLHQALAYLVQNALDFNVPDGAAHVSTYADENYALIMIQDNGTGIAPEDLPHIFEPFYRADKARSRSGTGLGLAITKKIIELHSGTIAVDSTLNIGTTFQVMLPLWLPDNASS